MKPYEVSITTSEGYEQKIDVEDPFHITTVTLGWNLWEWFKMLFGNREIQVRVRLNAHRIGALNRVMTALHDDCQKCGTGETQYHPDHGPDQVRTVMGESNG